MHLSVCTIYPGHRINVRRKRPQGVHQPGAKAARAPAAERAQLLRVELPGAVRSVRLLSNLQVVTVSVEQGDALINLLIQHSFMKFE